MLQIVYSWSRQYLVCSLCVLSVIYVIYYLFTIQNSIIIKPIEEPVIVHWPTINNNMSCDYLLEEDALPSVEDLNFSTGDKAIFFLETSCRGGINSRQACSIESAARLHPKWQINLLFTTVVTEYTLKKSCLSKLLNFPNVKLSRIHIDQYSRGTVIEELNVSELLIEHASDVLRTLTLHKFGGVYLDTDSLLIRSLDSLSSNWIAKKNSEDVATGAIAFSKYGIGANMTGDILRELLNTSSPTGWSNNGTLAYQRVLNRLCPNTLKSNKPMIFCKGVQIFSSEFFYPIYYSSHKEYFKNGTISSMEGPYMHHMWNYLTKDSIIEYDSPYANLARKYCPTIYEMYGNQFGA